MSRIVIHDPNRDDGEILAMLAGGWQEVITCRDCKALVAALAERPPDVLVYVIENLVEDLRLLATVRRVAPMLPIILLGGSTDLVARRSIQELKPTYYGVFPLDKSELMDAVHGALQRARAAH